MARFDTVLIANRGEIAVRLARACADEGLRSVAVYSDADRDAPHVRAADAAVRIGPPPARDSYLRADALVEAARRSGAGAVHPGYGFLSERAAFAHAVADAGLVFVGPPAPVIEAMGRKDRAREIAVAAGVPVVPAADVGGENVTTADLDVVAEQVGFPLLVKAAAGGGGKGMRIVRDRADLPQAVESAAREARAAFGDDVLLFERYIEHGRHIEVQVVADEHGHVVHLFERDCSVQRRHQKVIEEAPATTISPAVRELVCSASVALAATVGYRNAGTVEYLVSGDEAYFLEMNTRLQVEHPVTELVTGIDLARVQLTIAQGEPLPFGQDDLRVSGHAIEARVYAEDPLNAFLPQAGRARVVRWPSRVRVDAGLDEGQVVGTDYDPMLAKVIARGPTRDAARRALVRALDETAIIGVTTNIGFARALASSPEHAAAQITTAWLDEHPGVLSPEPPEPAWILAAWALATGGGGGGGPLDVADGWRLGGPPAPIAITLTAPRAAPDEPPRVLRVSPGARRVEEGDRSWQASGGVAEDGRIRLEIDGELVAGHVLVDAHTVHVVHRGQTWAFGRPSPFGTGGRALPSDGVVSAPMPGTVLVVNARVGDAVDEGETLGVLEAMKMELALRAPHAGTVRAVGARVGDQVELGAALFEVEPGEERS